MTQYLQQLSENLKLNKLMSSQEMTIKLYDSSLNIVFSDECGVDVNVDNDKVVSIISGASSIREALLNDDGKKVEYNYVPAVNNGMVEGVIVTAYILKNNDEAIEKAGMFMDCIDGINNAIDMMSIHFENLFDKLQSMQEKTGFIENGVKDTSAVVAKIRANASKSKILALNASIEAARSGEAGRGFSVVAKEMGEMASASGTSASDINDALKSIFSSLDDITVSINDANELAKKQTGSIEEIEGCLNAALEVAMQLGSALQD